MVLLPLLLLCLGAALAQTGPTPSEVPATQPPSVPPSTEAPQAEVTARLVTEAAATEVQPTASSTPSDSVKAESPQTASSVHSDSVKAESPQTTVPEEVVPQTERQSAKEESTSTTQKFVTFTSLDDPVAGQKASTMVVNVTPISVIPAEIPTSTVKRESVSTPRSVSTPVYEYTRISSTARAPQESHSTASISRTERPYTKVETPVVTYVQSASAYPATFPYAVPSPDTLDLESSPDTRTEELHEQELRVSTSVRPVVAEPVLYVTKPPKVVTAARPMALPVVRATTPKAVQVIQTVHTPYQSNAAQQAQRLQRPSGTHTVKKGGIKIKKPKKKDNGMSSLIYIPLMIQAQLIPMMLIKLKFLALKALTIGKLALLILGLNLLRNAMIGYDNDAEQYEHETTLANQHYGYNGAPEYGSWVNRRLHSPNSYVHRRRRYRPQSSTAYQERSDTEPRGNGNTSKPTANSGTNTNVRARNTFPNHPYRAHQNSYAKDQQS